MARRKSEQLFELHAGSPRGGRAAPGVTTRGRFDRRQESIIASSTLLFAREGYHSASMREIATAAGVSLANLYHYIDSKEQLLFFIQFRAFSGLLTQVQAQLLGVKKPTTQLRILVHTHIQYAVQNLASLKVCSHELDSLAGEAYEKVRGVRREYFALAQSIIGRILAERGDGPPLDVRIATMSLFGALNWIYRWYDPARDGSHSRLAAQIFKLFLAGLVAGDHLIGANGPPSGNHSNGARLGRRSRSRR